MRRPFNPSRPRRAGRRPPHLTPPLRGRDGEPMAWSQTEREVLSTARQLVDQYGLEASNWAQMRAAEFAAMGDSDGLAAWEAIVLAVEFLLAARAGVGRGLH